MSANMTMRSRLMRHQGAQDQGLTLIELLVTMIIMSVISGVVTVGIVTSLQDQRRERTRLDALSSGQRVVERVSKDVRAANPLVAADSSSVTMLVYHGTACQQRRYYVNTSAQLVEEIASYPASASCATRSGALGTAVSRVLLPKVANASSDPVFSYRRIDPAQDALVPVATPVTTTLVPLVDSVTVSLKAGLKENQAPVSVGTSVDLRNVERNS
jgi:prepilin-type N-terminal cleavage/methylation domain-containing protein